MELHELSVQLKNLAQTLDKNRSALNQPTFLKSASKFITALDRFEKDVAAGLEGCSAEVTALKNTLAGLFSESEAGKLRTMTGTVFEKAIGRKRDEQFPEYLLRIAQAAVEAGAEKEMADALQQTYAERAARAQPKDKESRLKRISEIGAMTPVELDREQKRLLDKPAELLALVSATRIRVKQDEAGDPIVDKTLFNQLLRLGRKLHQNVG
ncbi:MAG: hypothetical protein JO308_09360 [Verrucomicrobia bacterium]|nr:hypothetical protein [Verrucomicrobiota bacterium]